MQLYRHSATEQRNVVERAACVVLEVDQPRVKPFKFGKQHRLLPHSIVITYM